MARALRDPGRLTPGAMTRWMAWAFAVGSTCFLVGPFPGYQSLVGEEAAAATFFAGSLFFTAGGALQVAPAAGRRHAAGEGAALWRSAVVQPAATLFFNVTTFHGAQHRGANWNTVLGAACFLVCAAATLRVRAR